MTDLSYWSFCLEFYRSDSDARVKVRPCLQDRHENYGWLSGFVAEYGNLPSLNMFLKYVDSDVDWEQPGNHLQYEGSSTHVEIYPYPDKGSLVIHPSQFRALLLDLQAFSSSNLEKELHDYLPPTVLTEFGSEP